MGKSARRTERRRDRHLDPELLLVPLAIIWERREQRERAAQVPDRFLVRRPLRRALARAPVVRDRRRDEARLLVVPRDHLGLRLDALRKACLQHLADPSVELLARALQERLIRGLLDQCVPEGVRGVRRLAPREEDARLDQPCEVEPQRRIVTTDHRGEQRVRDLAPHDRRALRQRLRGRQAIEASHQRVGERGGNRVHAPRRIGLEH
jgi:hypothetical protein